MAGSVFNVIELIAQKANNQAPSHKAVYKWLQLARSVLFSAISLGRQSAFRLLSKSSVDFILS